MIHEPTRDEVADVDLLPENWTVLSWTVPLVTPRAGEGGFDEERQVHGSANRVCAETV